MDGGQLRQLEAWTKQGRLRYDVVAAARNGVVDTAAIARAITATHSNHIVAKLPHRRMTRLETGHPLSALSTLRPHIWAI